MQTCLLEKRPAQAVAIMPVTEEGFSAWRDSQSEGRRRWLDACGFNGQPGGVCLLPGEGGSLAAAVVGIQGSEDPWALGGLPTVLPPGDYFLDVQWPAETQARSVLGWGLGAYRFSRYKAYKQTLPRLAVPEGCDATALLDQLHALTLTRDLINTPAEDMMPENLADTLLALGSDFDAEVNQWVGKELLAENYPAIHAVGRASAHPPRLLELLWGNKSHPQLTLVGKGVCFDSGGLDLKSAAGMRLMKKDMGGAAHVIGLARMIMAARLKLRLRVLVPAVENAVAGNAFRPGDVLDTRKGLTVEVDNTDAEGRLILCDALTEASAEKPDLLMDFATLTGAARVALGAEVPALFCNDDAVAEGLLKAAREERDPLWRMPLHGPYRELLNSKVADIANGSSAPYGGAITAALFLREFVPEGIPWVHVDVMAWNLGTKPGRPEGGEAMGLRAAFSYLSRRYGH